MKGTMLNFEGQNIAGISVPDRDGRHRNSNWKQLGFESSEFTGHWTFVIGHSQP